MTRLAGRDFFGERRFTFQRIISRFKDLLTAMLTTAHLSIRNKVGRESLLGDTDVIVSLTSHGRRLRHVHLVVEAIGRGSVKPRTLVLWLDPGMDAHEVSSALRRAQRRGLTIRVSPEFFGPHTKYFPQALEMAQDPALEDTDLVTADDDILYARDWLANLMSRDTMNGKIIACYRAHRITLTDGRVAPYSQWGRVKTTKPSALNFATGVMGVRYPSSFVRHLAAQGPQFLQTCKNADDIWLHVSALRTGRVIQQIEDSAREFPFVIGSQKISLVSHNAFDGGNDQQTQATYTADDIARLSQAQTSRDLRQS